LEIIILENSLPFSDPMRKVNKNWKQIKIKILFLKKKKEQKNPVLALNSVIHIYAAIAKEYKKNRI
jgi:hypothetical protein